MSKGNGAVEIEARKESLELVRMYKVWGVARASKEKDAQMQRTIPQDEVGSKLFEFFRWHGMQNDESVSGPFCTRLSRRDQTKYAAAARRMLKCSYTETADGDRIRLWNLPELRAHRIGRVRNEQVVRDIVYAHRSEDEAQQEDLARRSDYEEWLVEQKEEQAEAVVDCMIEPLAEVKHKEFKALFAFLRKRCDSSTGRVTESAAAIFTAWLAHQKAADSKVPEAERERFPRIKFDLIADYLQRHGQISSKRGLEVAHRWMYRHLPGLLREFFGVDNPALLGPLYAEKINKGIGSGDAAWLYAHIGWGQADAARRALKYKKAK